MELARRLIAKPSAWQRVIHGEGLDLRGPVLEALISSRSTATALRYAMCGFSDRIVRGEGGAEVHARGCGHRLCPRCGRRRGGKYSRRIMGWLGYEDHGDILSICITHRVIPGESLAAARTRMAGKQRKFMRWLTRAGMVGAMTVAHVVWSLKRGGWHYHVHVLAEMPAGTMTEDRILAGWKEAAAPEWVSTDEKQRRLVCAAGPAMKELRDDAGDPDFWVEAASAVAKSVQYPLRDIVQGVSQWRLGGDPERVNACAAELVQTASGWKMFRAWGRWRHKCPAAGAAAVKVEPEVKPPEEDGAGKKKAAPGGPEVMGTVSRVWREARKGSVAARAVFRQLEGTVRHNTKFARRFVWFCRHAQGPAPGG